jgi:hypothetical protein
MPEQQLVQAVVRLDRVTQGEVVGANEVRPAQRDEKRSLHGPPADPLNL